LFGAAINNSVINRADALKRFEMNSMSVLLRIILISSSFCFRKDFFEEADEIISQAKKPEFP